VLSASFRERAAHEGERHPADDYIGQLEAERDALRVLANAEVRFGLRAQASWKQSARCLPRALLGGDRPRDQLGRCDRQALLRDGVPPLRQSGITLAERRLLLLAEAIVNGEYEEARVMAEEVCDEADRIRRFDEQFVPSCDTEGL